MLTSDQHIDLEDGRFARTTAEQLRGMFDAFERDGSDHLVVHFHGGLVGRKSAHAIGESLSPIYRAAGTYPVFFVWNSDPRTILLKNLDEIAREVIFKRLLLRLAQLLAGRLDDVVGGSRGGRVELESLMDMPHDAEDLHAYLARFDAVDERESDAVLSDLQETQARNELEDDTVLREEATAIAASLRSEEEIEQEEKTRGRGTVRRSRDTLMSRSVLDEIAAESGPETPGERDRGIFTTTLIVTKSIKILAAVLSRYARRRDHGLYTTIVEEVLRALYIESLGSIGWTTMKKDTADAFGADAARHGGTAFVDHLVRTWSPDRRLTLVGHSTGAIYIGELLRHANKRLPREARVKVALLAPACTFAFFDALLPVLEQRVANIRLFALSDELERGYWEVPAIYPASLLYLVSALFEEDQDMPLVGMQRYYDVSGPYDRPEIDNVVRYLDGGVVWSVTDGGAGRRSEARKHGAFDEDAATCASLRDFIAAET